MTRVRATATGRVIELLCDTKDCEETDVYICPKGVIACEKHKPKSKGEGNGKESQ